MKAIVWYYAILFEWFQQKESCGVHTGVSWLSVLQIQWWLTVLFRIQTHNMHNVLLLFIIVHEMLGAGVNWSLGLTIGTGNRYQIPSGYQDSDYSNFASLVKVVPRTQQRGHSWNLCDVNFYSWNCCHIKIQLPILSKIEWTHWLFQTSQVIRVLKLKR